MPTSTRLALAVRYVMETDNLSMRKLAEQSGVHYSHLCDVLNCKKESTMTFWDRVAGGLNTSVPELLKIKERHLETVLASKNQDEILPKSPRRQPAWSSASRSRKALAT
jgi:hypothetical protein